MMGDGEAKAAKRPKRGKRVRTPIMLQMEAADCGATSLGIILGYYGRYVPLEELRGACGVSRDGSKASNIIKAAKGYGLTAKGFKYELEKLYAAPTPVIVFWNFNHFLVVEGFGKYWVYLNDPAAGRRRVSYEEFDKSYTGVTLTFSPGPEFQRIDTRRSLYATLAPRLRGSQLALIYVTLVGLALVAPGLLIPSFSRIFVDEILIGGARDWLPSLLLAMGLTALLRGGLVALRRRYLGRLETKLALAGASRFLWHLLRLPVSFFSVRQSGDLGQRVASNDELSRLLSGELAENAINALMVIFYAALIFSYDPVLCGIAVVTALLNVVALRWVGRYREEQSLRLQQDRGKLYGTGVAGIQIIESLKAGGLENDFFARMAGYQTKVTNAEQDVAVSDEALQALPQLLASLTFVAVMGIGGMRVMDGRLSMGELIAAQSLTASFLQPVGGLLGLASTIQQVRGALRRIEDVLSTALDPLAAAAPVAPALPSVRTRLTGAIELRQLTFGYSRLEPPLIEGLNLSVRPGGRIALVGGSGSGKSTVAKLATGLYQPWSGEILFDGVPMKDIPRPLLQSSLAMVDQDIFLFDGSVRDNITMWDATIPEHQLVSSAQDATIHDEISQRESGYDTRVEEGGKNWSGGQRQRLELARALAGNPSLVILDEGTSALDPLTEVQVDRNLRRRGCTCLIIAHRLSTIRDCDEILVLSRGKVVERGTHEELMQRNGHYAQLIQNA